MILRIFALFFVLFLPRAHGAVISTVEEEIYLGREYIEEECEWNDIFLIRTITRHRDSQVGQLVVYTTGFSPRLPSDYHDFRQTCLLLFHASIEEKEKAGCIVEIGRGAFSGAPVFSFLEWEEINTRRVLKHSDFCENDCHTPVPESGTLPLFLTGVVFLVVSRGMKKCRSYMQ